MLLFILMLSVIMAVVTLAAGFAPLMMTTKVDTRKLSQFGSGIILSAAFMIVIPEGYEQIGESWARLAGVAVVFGFLLMLVIDKFVSVNEDEQAENALYSDLPPSEIGINGDNIARAVNTPYESPKLRELRTWLSGLSVTTLGLTIHAAADGIALGATSGSSNTNLGILVFLSIMIHKAPAAFSLTSILLTQEGYTNAHVKRDIFLFSMAGPVLAVVLGALISMFSFTTDSTVFPGFCLALSGGTFVYVACHVLVAHGSFKKEGFWNSMILITAGTVLPFIATFLPD